MKLDNYLLTNNMTQETFSKKSGVAQSLLSAYIAKKVTPSLKNILKIQRATGGLVAAEDFLDDVETPLSPVV